MRFKIDENLPVEAAEILQQAGYDASTVVQQYMGGEADPVIASVCQRERCALVTLDIGFSDIRMYPPKLYPGLIVLRLRQQEKPRVLEVLRHLIPVLASERLEHRLWIVEEDRIRIRD